MCVNMVSRPGATSNDQLRDLPFFHISVCLVCGALDSFGLQSHQRQFVALFEESCCHCQKKDFTMSFVFFREWCLSTTNGTNVWKATWEAFIVFEKKNRCKKEVPITHAIPT